MDAVLQRKFLNQKALDVDTTGKRVKIAIAEMESVDSDGDMFAPTAFDKTIAERGPKGSNSIWHMTDHGWQLRSSLSKFSELYVEGKYLVGVSPYRDTALWRDTVWPLYEAGDITEHSVGFMTIKDDRSNPNYRLISEVFLLEGSAVCWGANSNTPTMAVLKSWGSTQRKEYIDGFTKRIERLIKGIDAGKFTDDTSLLKIHLKEIQAAFIALNEDATEPPVLIGTQPDHDAQLLLDIKSHFKELLKN
ncbi:hypothetical protein DCC81_24740 [Chitinophaga parva]|uniref:Prohead serine protease domain-containing protein n=1 Tax=Chitinophaga parva TaxID=2169414 RepID=A0A2T7BBU3_9BACT|nr:HK97 family phage prohead protease [Chitinophaga parva]PUZ21798.1 hypothetical protein DCC81_24740 [Chitinophaga parva]